MALSGRSKPLGGVACEATLSEGKRTFPPEPSFDDENVILWRERRKAAIS